MRKNLGCCICRSARRCGADLNVATAKVCTVLTAECCSSYLVHRVRHHCIAFIELILYFALLRKRRGNTSAMPQRDVVGDGRLRPRYRHLGSRPNNVVWRPTGAATWRTGRNVTYVSSLIVACSRPKLYKNMTSSTKPEVHNLSHCRQKRIELRPQLTCTEIWWNLEFWDTQAIRHTNKQTKIQTRVSQYFAPLLQMTKN